MVRTPLTTRWLSVVLATGLALTTAACTGDASTDAPEQVMQQMTEAVADAGSVRLTLGTKQSPEDLRVDTTWTGEPAFKAITGGEPTQQLDIRRVGDRAYLGGELVGLQWTYLEVDDPRLADPESNFDAGPVPTLLAIDVPGDLAALADAVTEVSDEGLADIDGQPAELYALTVTTQEWFDALDERSMYRGMDLPETFSMNLYVDDDSLPVRLDYQVPDNPAESAQIDFSRWGTPVEVKVPARAKPLR